MLKLETDLLVCELDPGSPTGHFCDVLGAPKTQDLLLV